MAITEEALKQIVGALRPPPDGTDVQARDLALLVRLRGWAAEFGTPPKELRAERRLSRQASQKREAALLEAFCGAAAAWDAMEENGEREVVRLLFENFRTVRFFEDAEDERVYRVDFLTARAAFLALCQAFQERGQQRAAVSSVVAKHKQRRPIEARARRAILELANIYRDCTGVAPGITVSLDEGHPRRSEWFKFATSITKAAWNSPYAGIVREVTAWTRQSP